MSGNEFLEFRAFILCAQNMILIKRSSRLVFLKMGACFDEIDAIHTSIKHAVAHER